MKIKTVEIELWTRTYEVDDDVPQHVAERMIRSGDIYPSKEVFESTEKVEIIGIE